MAIPQTNTPHDWHRYFAIELNQLTWKLLETPGRTPEQDNLMIQAAHASYFHWLQVGSAVNFTRGEWMCSRVYVVLSFVEPALRHAGNALSICQAHGLADFDLAYAYEALARAHAASGQHEEARRYRAMAAQAGDAIKDDEDRKIFVQDLHNGSWFGLPR